LNSRLVNAVDAISYLDGYSSVNLKVIEQVEHSNYTILFGETIERIFKIEVYDVRRDRELGVLQKTRNYHTIFQLMLVPR